MAFPFSGRVGRLRGIWRLRRPFALTARATPAECLRLMTAALKPRLEQLHLESLYFDGRRYYLQQDENGFRLTNTSRLRWGYRKRNSVAAIGFGSFSDSGGGLTQIQLRFRIAIRYFLRGIFIPAFMTSIIIFVPWPQWLIALLIVALFALSFLDRWLLAALQADEIAHFVETTLRDCLAEVPSLAADGADVVAASASSEEFEQVWEKFYEQRRQKQDEPDEMETSRVNRPS